MVGKITSSHGKKYTTYACPNHKGGGCPTKNIRARELEEYTAAVIVKELRMGSNLPQLNKCLKSGGGNAEAKQLRNRLTGTEKKIDNIVKNLENGYSEALTNRLSQLEAEKVSLMDQLQRVSQPVPSITEENLKQIKEKLVNCLMTSDNPEVKELLRAYIIEICVSNDDVTINLKI